MKKFLLILVVLVLMAPAAVFASSGQNVPDGIMVVNNDARFIDTEGLLSSSEASALTKRLDEVSATYNFDTVVAVVDTLNGWGAREYAAELYEAYGFNQGGGAILLIATEDRDWGFATTGTGLDIFNNAGQDFVYAKFLPYLADDDYAGGFMAYAGAIEEVIVRYEMGEPVRAKDIPKTDSERAGDIRLSVILSIIIALVIALIVNGVLRGQLKSVKPQNFAKEYVRQGSMVVTAQSDRFLYRHVTRTAIPKDNNGGRGFSSSSGGSYSGSSGKY